MSGSFLRDAAGEVDSCQVLGGGDGVPEHGPVGGEELDDVWGQTTFPQDSVDSVAGRHGRVTGLPQDHVPLQHSSSCTVTDSASISVYCSETQKRVTHHQGRRTCQVSTNSSEVKRSHSCNKTLRNKIHTLLDRYQR